MLPFFAFDGSRRMDKNVGDISGRMPSYSNISL